MGIIGAMIIAGIAGVNAFFIPNPANVATTVFCGLMAIIVALLTTSKK